jgi:protein KTI12
MPLVVFCGPPCSGKTTRAKALYEHIKNELKRDAVLINEESLLIKKNEGYIDSKAEKSTRGTIKSALERAISKDTIVILDSLNYIKGFRYEIFCISRASATPQCVVYCDAPQETTLEWNAQRTDEKWDEKLLAELYVRFEEPIERNRWDSPLFRVGPTDELPIEPIVQALTAPLKHLPTIATQQETISDVNYLYDIDKITQEIINYILERQNNSNPGDEIAIANSNVKLKLTRKLNLAELRRVRRQYLSLTKQLYTTQARQSKQSLQEISEAFVNYLNTNLNQE